MGDVMIDRQARLISEQRAIIDGLRKDNDRLDIENERLRRSAGYYDMLQKAIVESPTLQSEWRRFIAIAKLSFDEPVKGLTRTEFTTTG
jgi:hypothetical protein